MERATICQTVILGKAPENGCIYIIIYSIIYLFNLTRHATSVCFANVAYYSFFLFLEWSSPFQTPFPPLLRHPSAAPPSRLSSLPSPLKYLHIAEVRLTVVRFITGSILWGEFQPQQLTNPSALAGWVSRLILPMRCTAPITSSSRSCVTART